MHAIVRAKALAAEQDRKEYIALYTSPSYYAFTTTQDISNHYIKTHDYRQTSSFTSVKIGKQESFLSRQHLTEIIDKAGTRLNQRQMWEPGDKHTRTSNNSCFTLKYVQATADGAYSCSTCFGPVFYRENVVSGAYSQRAKRFWASKSQWRDSNPRPSA